MGVTFEFARDGNKASVIEGIDSNVRSYSVQEDATTQDISNFNGGFGQITLEANPVKDSLYGLTDTVVLKDSAMGSTSGIVREVTESESALSIVADSVLGLFASDHIVPPQTGTLGEAFAYYCAVAGVTNSLKVDETIRNRSVLLPGWSGNMWDNIKQILASQKVEMSLVFNDVVVRPLRSTVANTNRNVGFSKRVNNQNTSKKIEVFYYNNTAITNLEVYPWNITDPSIYTVDAGQTVVVRLNLNASLGSVNQPVCVAFVPDQETPLGNGVYSVAGNDGIPITPAQWAAQGGNLTVKLVEPSVLEVTIVGAVMTQYAPYRIAMTAGPSSYYNSLRITGTGIRWDKKSVVIDTGSTAAVTGEDIGVTVDTPFINTYGDALDVGLIAAGRHAMQYELTGNAFNLNRQGGGTSHTYARISDFNSYYWTNPPISDFNVAWSGQTIAQFNSFWNARVVNLFENQAFGNTAGARVLTDDANFRIVSATTTPEGVDYTAELDTLISDFNQVKVGATIADFNTQFAGATCQDFSITPLRKP